MEGCVTSVTIHPTQVNTPRLNSSQTGWYSIYPPQRDGRLSLANLCQYVQYWTNITPILLATRVDIKVINASLTQNQCLQCVTPPLTHAEIDTATELNNDGMIKFVHIHYQTERNFINFSERDLINDVSSFCSLILSAIDLHLIQQLMPERINDRQT